MPENTKINLSALMKKDTPTGEEKTIAPEQAVSADNEQQVDAIAVEDKPETSTTIESELISNEEKEVPTLTDAIDTEQVDQSKIEEKLEDTSPSRRHSLSLDGIKSPPKAAEKVATQEDREQQQQTDQIEKELEAVHAEAQSEKQEAKEKENELFGNYESKFTNQSTKILKRLRMPRTRVWMLVSLCFVCVIIVWSLMYVDPDTHSISNYKASVKSIYNDIKKGETPQGPTGVINPSEDISRKDNIQNQEISEEVILDKEKPKINKDEIKKENLKNFLIENYR